MKIEISIRAVVQRINRALPEGVMLRAARNDHMRTDLGDYYIVDAGRGLVTERRVNLEKLASQHGVIKEWEVIAKEGVKPPKRRKKRYR